ncbi:MAG: diguanylate cyclase [Candidatus Manganitrophus sp.]|nr:MAG: diguanylate cyclase [Candidatus Manganitrophus sp.]
MKNRPTKSSDKRSQEKLQGKNKISKRSTPDKMARLLQELQAHHIELEMQNEALLEAQAMLEESRNRYSDLYDFAPLGYFTFDCNGFILGVNLTGADQLGMERQQIVEKPFSLYVAQEDQPHFRDHLAAVFHGGGRRHCEIKMKGRNTSYYVQLESLLVEEEGGDRCCRTAMTDITPRKRAEEETKKINELLESRILQRTIELKTANQVLQNEVIERKKAEQALARQANLDALTGLYNRRYFDLRADEEIARADRKGSCLAILLCDLDHFKSINDTLGHQTGDRVLKSVAQNIQECTREIDLVFRWGGDEIAVLLIDTSREGVLITAERIRSAVKKRGEEAQLPLDISIGVAFYPEHGVTIDGLISLADRSLYIAKQGGDKIHIGAEEYLLDDRSIKVVFQPVVDLRSGRSIGYEALTRDPQGKLTAPELFQRYQAIGQLNELKRLCFSSQLNEAQRLGLQGGRLFLNVDFHLLHQIELMQKPEGIDVILEISEMEALHSHHVESYLALAEKWRAQGFQLAIDDFGAGFVSFPFIAQLVPEYIKIDRSTLLQAVSSLKFRKFLKDLVFALQNYTTRGIVAEGIETEQELAVVREMGVDLGQGFLFGRPEPLMPA